MFIPRFLNKSMHESFSDVHICDAFVYFKQRLLESRGGKGQRLLERN